MSTVTSRAAVRRPRAFLRVAGPDAADFLQRMVSNDVEALAPGESCAALLLTPKSRLIAPLRVLRRRDDDFLVSTEPELGDVVRATLLRARFAAKCELEPEQHEAWEVLGGGEMLDQPPDGEELDDAEFERRRIDAGIPRWGSELDDRVLPAEAGLDETHVSFTKGCYPGQEPIARQRYRGKLNRRLRVFDVDGSVSPGDEIHYGEKVVGRITSAADGVALGYVRTDVEEQAELTAGQRRVRPRLP
ncbi:MAG: folate-binding protein YgfZ [Actinobacteria bacterium]|nr:MAG: folate-binding protein YgfZ [Actinomycetota bacterium]